MTPLHQFLSRHLGDTWAAVVLAIVYALLLWGILLSVGATPPSVLYVDVQADPA
jgi:hypothetical protein